MSNTRNRKEFVNISDKSINDIARKVISEHNRMDEDKDNKYGMMIFSALFLIHFIDLLWLVFFSISLVAIYTIGGSSIVRCYFAFDALLIAVIWLFVFYFLCRHALLKPDKPIRATKVTKWGTVIFAIYTIIGTVFFFILDVSKSVFNTVLLEEYVGAFPERILGLIGLQLAGVMVMVVVYMITKAVKDWGKTWRFNVLSIILASVSCVLSIIGIMCSMKA